MHDDAPSWLVDGPADAAVTVVLAHGAGAPMDSPFMEHVAQGIAAAGVRVVRFEFPYMAARRQGAGKRGPDTQRVLEAAWREVHAALGPAQRLVIGGKSLGGRIASLVADELEVAGLVCLGYPFHPPGKPQQVRTAHLQDLRTPTLIVQGERDPFGRPDEVAGYGLSPAVEVGWIPDGDHSFAPRVRSGRTTSQNLDLAVEHVLGFVRGS